MYTLRTEFITIERAFEVMEFIENLQHQTKIQMPTECLQQMERNNQRRYINRNCEMRDAKWGMKLNRMQYHIENEIVQTFNSIIRRTNKQTNKCITILMDADTHTSTPTHTIPIAMGTQVRLVCFLTLAFIEVCLAHIQLAINHRPMPMHKRIYIPLSLPQSSLSLFCQLASKLSLINLLELNNIAR